ncbi:MAG: LuxR C-terminal-related transcriptional regulator [Pseudomonadota bacterium]
MIIPTKIQLPLLKSNLLNRKHLTDRLSTGKDSQLILITGPAGCGKTSLAGQWIKQDKVPAAWYSIDDTDNDLDVFFRYFITALIEANNGLEDIIGPLLQNQTRIIAKDIVPPIIHALNTLIGEIYLIIDDYHMINADEIHQALGHIIKYLPHNMHLAIISRHKLPQPLSRFRFQYDILEITPDDLKFSEHEANNFFKQVIPLDLTENQIRDLTQFAGGWVAGFHILGLSLKKGKSLQVFDKTLQIACREAIDYLMNEVIGFQSENVKMFLYHTAVLYRFNADVCKFVTGMPDAAKILNELTRMNMFLVPLDPELKWYRYHHLFSEAIIEWVKISSPDLLKHAQQKAALWFAKHNYIEDAFHYAVASGDFEFTADLMEDYLKVLVEKYEIASAMRWLSKLPHEVFIRRPLLRLIECTNMISNIRPADVENILSDIETRQNEAIENYKEPKKSLCKDLIVYTKTVLHYYQDTFKVDIKKMTEGAGMISQKNRPLAGYIQILIALNQIYLGNLKFAEDQIEKAFPDIFPSEFNMAKITWTMVMAFILRSKGCLNQSEKILQDAFTLLKRQKLYGTPLKYLLYLPMAVIFYNRNDLDNALEYGSISLRYAEISGNFELIMHGYFLLSQIYMAKENRKEAMEYNQKLRNFSKNITQPNLSKFADALAASLSIAQGDVGYTLKWENQENLNMDEEFSMYFFFKAMNVAITHIFKGKLPQAIDILEKLRVRCVKRSLMELVLVIDIILSGMLWMYGKKQDATSKMKKALLFSEPQGYIRPFANCSIMILPVLNDIAKNSPEFGQSVYFNTLLTACGGIGENKSLTDIREKDTTTYGLTERELEILELLADGHKNREIADMSFISINTVKTHTQNLYKKLGVKSRLQAIVQSQNTKLLN